jgi:hypothetical protein
MTRQHETEVSFRGGKREVTFEYEGDGVIVWAFADEQVCGGVDATQAEQDDVYAQLWTYLEDWWAGQDDPS